MLKLMYVTNDCKIVEILENSGVDRAFVDLEFLGKAERQKGLDTVKSKHTEKDVEKISKRAGNIDVLVRVNPINDDSEREMNSVTVKGADIVMLPMFKTEKEVEKFINLLDNKSRNILLLEHIDAVKNLDEILEIPGIDEIHIGLNDLHLSMGLTFMFELFSNGIVEEIVEKIRKKNIPFGIGGISKLGDGDIPAEMIIAEHHRLGSQAAIISRGFCDLKRIRDYNLIEKLFCKQVKEIREYEKSLDDQDDEFFNANRAELEMKIKEVVKRKSKLRYGNY